MRSNKKSKNKYRDVWIRMLPIIKLTMFWMIRNRGNKNRLVVNRDA